MLKWTYLVALVSFTVHAGFYPTSERNCTELDLRSPSLGEVRDQGKLSWCYAFTAADMLAHTFDHQNPISAADIAINYNTTRSGRFVRWLNLNLLARRDRDVLMSSPHETGFNKIALIRTMHHGSCPESVFPSEEWIKLVNTPQGTFQQRVPLEQALLDMGELHKNRRELTVENLPFTFDLKNLTAEAFVDIIKNNTLPRAYDKLRKLVCKDDRQEFEYRWKVKMVFRHSNIFWRLGEQLSLGRVVGLDYDARILENRNHRGVKLSELHTSSVVGRRWNKERLSCQWLVKDSHGKQCDLYDPSYDCEDGYIWLDEKLIYPNMTSLVYMLSRIK